MAQTVFDSPTAVGAKILTVTATVTNTSGAYTNTITDERITTAMKAIEIELGDPSVFGANITVTCNNGSITISCNDVEGTSTVSIDVIKTVDDPTSVTSIEFDVLNSRLNKVKAIINDVSEYSDESTYSAGDRVWYSGKLYKANQDIDIAEDWDSTHWDQEDVVEKVDELDDSINALQDAIAIVAVGNTHGAVTTGQFVYVKNHDTLAEGLYKASTDIAANDTLSSSNLTADSSGGLNDLKSQIPPVVNNLTSNSTTSALSAAQGKALNSNLANSNVQSCSGEAAVKTYLESVMNDMNSGESRLLRISNTSSSFTLMDQNIYYEGYIFCTHKNGANKNCVWIGYSARGKDVVFSNESGSWNTPYSLNSKLSQTPVVDSTNHFSLVKVGNIVSVWSTAWTTNNAVIPSGYRPSANLFCPAIDSTGGTFIQINTNGTISNQQRSSDIVFAVTYAV